RLDAGGDAGLDAAESAVAAAAAELERTRSTATALRTRLDELTRQRAEASAGIAGMPDLDALVAELAETRLVEERLAEAKARLEAARKAVAEATDSLDSLAGQERETRRLLQQARDSVAPLGPPMLEMLDVAGDWKLLMEWVSITTP